MSSSGGCSSTLSRQLSGSAATAALLHERTWRNRATTLPIVFRCMGDIGSCWCTPRRWQSETPPLFRASPRTWDDTHYATTEEVFAQSRRLTWLPCVWCRQQGGILRKMGLVHKWTTHTSNKHESKGRGSCLVSTTTTAVTSCVEGFINHAFSLYLRVQRSTPIPWVQCLEGLSLQQYF